MKKFLLLLLVTLMIVSMAACTQTNSSTSNSNTTNPSDGHTHSPTAPETSEHSTSPEPSVPSVIESVVYEPNLPEDIILTKGETKISVVNKRAHEIFDGMELLYTEQTQYDENNYANGVPYTLFYKGEDKEGWTFIQLVEWFDAGYENVHLHSVTVNFNTFDFPDDITILGINKSATKEDVFNILGSPHSEIEEIKSHNKLYTYYWKNVSIGDTIIPCITVEFAKDSLIYTNICFDK